MTVRPPQALASSFTRDSGLNLLEYELMSERADALGRHGLKVEKAIAALAAMDEHTSPERRDTLLNEAADVVWAFFIQREICGLRSNRDAIQRYAIPKEVVARLGIVRPKTDAG
jgi:membrane-bound lytic murein transglycosylase MltF